MPPSAGACHTTDAALNPDCGRAGPRSSTMTAIGWRRATAGVTSRPVSGAGTRTGVGVGVGVGTGVAVGVGDAVAGAVVGVGPVVGAADGGVVPRAAISPDPAAV